MASAMQQRLSMSGRNACAQSSSFQSCESGLTATAAWQRLGFASGKYVACQLSDHHKQSRRWHVESEEHVMAGPRRSGKPDWGVIGQQRKHQVVNAGRNDRVPESANGRKESISDPDKTQSDGTPMEDQFAPVQSEGLPKNAPEVDLALQQAQKQLDLFTKQLQEYAETDASMLGSKEALKPESLSSMGAGRGLWQAPQAPPFPGGMGKGQNMPPELLEALEGAERREEGETLFPEDRYFEEVSKEELKELLYGDGRLRENDRRRASKETSDEGLEWEFGVPSEAGGGFRKRSGVGDDTPQGSPTSLGKDRDTSASPEQLSGSMGQGKASRLGEETSAKALSGMRPPLATGTLSNGASVPPLPPPRVLQSRIPPAPAPSPNLLPISPLQRPSSWLSESYPSAPRLPFNSGRPPVNGPTETPPNPASLFKVPQPPMPPAPPVSSRADLGGGATLGGPEGQVPWPPLPPVPGLGVPFEHPGKSGMNLDGGSDMGRAMPSEAQKLFSEGPTRSLSATSSSAPMSDSFPSWPSDQDGSDGVNSPPSLPDEPLDTGVRLRETPQLQSEELRRLFAMSPEELRALDRRLAAGDAQLDLSALGLLPGAQSAPAKAPPGTGSAQQPAAESGFDAAPKIDDVVSRTVDDVGSAVDDVSRLWLRRSTDKARTLDSIIDDLSSVTANGGFASSDAVSDGRTSVDDLLERLKRLVDISEKAIGDLAFGGALPEGEGDDDDKASLPWYEEPGTCMDHEFYYGGGGPREGTENVANLFADETLARERFSRPPPYGPFPTGSTAEGGPDKPGTDGADVAPSGFREVEDADVDTGEGLTLAVSGSDMVRQKGAVSEEAVAVLRPEANVGTGSGASEFGQNGQSFEEAGLSNSQSAEPVLGNETGTSGADMESMAASLGMFQDAGPNSKVTTFEAPRAKSAAHGTSEGKSAEAPGTEGGGGWVGQKMTNLSSGYAVGLEEAVKAAVSVHTGPEKRGKKEISKERGLSKAFLDRVGTVASGSNEGPGRGKKAKKRRKGKDKTSEATEFVTETALEKVEEGPSEKAVVRGKGSERDSVINAVLFGDRKGGPGQRSAANPILRQAVAAVGKLEDPQQPDVPLEVETAAPLADASEAATENAQEASGDPRPTQPNSGSGTPNPEVLITSVSDTDPSRSQTAGTPPASALSGSPFTPENLSERSGNLPGQSSKAHYMELGDSSSGGEGSPSPGKATSRKEAGFPDWMPKFFDTIHPESPNFDPEEYANTHPIKRAMLDNDSQGLFPDFSEEALRKPIPGLAKLSVPDAEHTFENPASNSVSKDLVVSPEQRRQVLDAANAATFDPAAYDKTAPPWEAFRGFGTGSRELDDWDMDHPVNLPEGEEEFEIPMKGGGTKRVKIPAGGFRNEQELIDAFGDLGTYPYMADTYDPVTDDDVLEEVPPPDIPPEDADMLTKVSTLSYSMRDYLGMDQDPTANFFKKGLVNSFVTFEDPLHCFTSAALLEDWFDIFTRNGYPPSLDFIWYESDPAHRWKKWIYTTLTVTLPKDLKHQLEAWGAHGWYEAEFGHGPEEPEPEPQPEGPEPDIMPEFRKVVKRAGLSPMKKPPKPLVLEMFSKFEMDESGKVTLVFTKWDDFEEDHARSSPRVLAKRRLFMAALLRKEWGR